MKAKVLKKSRIGLRAQVRAGESAESKKLISNNPSVIGPASREHHKTILSECGLKLMQEEIFGATDYLRKAHRSAGFKLSEILMKQVKGSRLDDLRSNGKQEFGGTEEIPSKKTMFYIESIESEVFMVPSHEIGRPFKLTSKFQWRK